jgi:hypothetical protein
MPNDLYNRTQNDNGTYNTRCLHCFMTVASSIETEQELADVEARHICPERALADLLNMQINHDQHLVAKFHLN